MVNLGTAQLAGVTMVVGILAIAGTNFAFAQQPCIENQAYTYVGCTPMGTAQMYGAAIVVGVAAFAAVCGAVGRQHHIIP